MSDFGSSAARQRRLAGELRRLRRRARLTGKDVSAQFGWSEAKLSRIETGQARVKMEDLDRFLDLYQISDSHRAELAALAQESREAGPLEELEGDVPTGHFEIMDAESEAETAWNWEPQVVPGLLQTENYTRAVLQLWPGVFARPAAEVERRVETGRIRQRVLTRVPALDLCFVIDESVLLRGFATPLVMREQLVHMVEISEHPNIELRILALRGSQVVGTGAFDYFRFPRIHGVPRSDAVAVEHLQGTTFVESEEDVNTYRVVFGALREKSLSPQASRDVLARVAREAWGVG
jgi:transcriptional regulator with XRE-family HTH domain